MNKNIIIYTSSLCGFCYRAKSLLKKKNIPFEEIDIDLDYSKRNEILTLSEQSIRQNQATSIRLYEIVTKFDVKHTDTLLTTTRAVRKRLDLNRLVEEQQILKCLEISQQAPTGSNRQGWQWVIITDKGKRRIIANYYRQGAGDYLEEGKNSARDRGA